VSADQSAGILGRVSTSIEAYHVGQATAVGILAFPVAYLLTIVTILIGGSIDTSRPIEAARVVGYAFYNAHNVPLHRYGERAVSGPDGTTLQEISATGTLLQESATSIPTVVYYLIPVVVLLGAGALLAYRYLPSERQPTSERRSVRHLALVGGLVLGYTLAMLAGSFLFAETTTSGQTWVSLNPERLSALVAGIGYPLVLGAVGSTAVLAWRRIRE
jgi:hypothetical protein